MKKRLEEERNELGRRKAQMAAAPVSHHHTLTLGKKQKKWEQASYEKGDTATQGIQGMRDSGKAYGERVKEKDDTGCVKAENGNMQIGGKIESNEQDDEVWVVRENVSYDNNNDKEGMSNKMYENQCVVTEPTVTVNRNDKAMNKKNAEKGRKWNLTDKKKHGVFHICGLWDYVTG